ncbi:hypothetical protein CO172_02780 [Candidatus Uhrbacteria bacterium CG_4_9_14_3_um_filter_36_7]|uniref:Uncharacterized protein n=1 Tax=Candidatus Uhrbacteria bacterium CG_4_9_14_3_um_filter_36_7 TaxID=1975033 RepID=A0A2M7XHK3_9BACT|nr:MAG: hypothetical protein CO172_02780 [Candidatus Uhrbacteria bacterium CG_4_9_14_3_um_filter_36_7]
MNIYKQLFFFYLFLLILFPLETFAAGGLQNPLVSDSIPILIGYIIRVLLGVSGALALLMFVWGGFLWLTSGGAEKRIASGRQTLVWAAIGLVVIFSSYTVVTAVIKALTTGSPI